MRHAYKPLCRRPERLRGGDPVQQGLSAAIEFAAHDGHRGAADKRYSLAIFMPLPSSPGCFAELGFTQLAPVSTLRSIAQLFGSSKPRCGIYLLEFPERRFYIGQAVEPYAKLNYWGWWLASTTLAAGRQLSWPVEDGE